MVTSPVIVWRQGHDTDDSADPIVRKTAAEKRAVAAVVLDHEEADEQARRGRRQQQANPMAVGKDSPHQSPDHEERHCCDHQFENAARAAGLAITGVNCANARFPVGFEPYLDCSRTCPFKEHGLPTDPSGNSSKTAWAVHQVDWRAREASSTLEAFFCCVDRLLSGSGPVASTDAVLS
jgi:hypothetical protein